MAGPTMACRLAGSMSCWETNLSCHHYVTLDSTSVTFRFEITRKSHNQYDTVGAYRVLLSLVTAMSAISLQDEENVDHKALDDKSAGKQPRNPLTYIQAASDSPLSETARLEPRFATSRTELYAYYVYYIGDSMISNKRHVLSPQYTDPSSLSFRHG